MAADIAPSFYRLIEAGLNHLSISKVAAIHNAFDHRISLEGLVFMIGSIAASEEVSKEDKKLNIRRSEFVHKNALAIWSALPATNPFRSLLAAFLRPISELGLTSDLAGNIDLQKCVLQCSEFKAKRLRTLVTLAQLDDEVATLLQNYNSYGPGLSKAGSDYANRFFTEIPSVYKSMLDGFRDQIRDLPRTFSHEGSWDWEKRNRRHFVELVAVCQAHHVVNRRNLERYRFEYLWQESFQRATFLMMDQPRYAPDLMQREFWRNLKGELAKGSREGDEEVLKHCNAKIEAKTLFVPAVDGESRQQLADLLKGFGQRSKPMNAMWFFRTDDGAVIGAAAFIDEEECIATHIRFLTFSECQQALAPIDQMLSSTR